MSANNETKIDPALDLSIVTTFEKITIDDGASQIQQAINSLQSIVQQVEYHLVDYNRSEDKDARINNLQAVINVLMGTMSNIRFDMLSKVQLDLLKVEHKKIEIMRENGL